MEHIMYVIKRIKDNTIMYAQCSNWTQDLGYAKFYSSKPEAKVDLKWYEYTFSLIKSEIDAKIIIVPISIKEVEEL